METVVVDDHEGGPGAVSHLPVRDGNTALSQISSWSSGSFTPIRDGDMGTLNGV
jgi:hypothetical protein